MFQSDDYTLMIPMTIRDSGTGINDMTVRIHKIHLDHVDSISTPDIDDDISVDIKVGDAIRFVYNDNIFLAGDYLLNPSLDAAMRSGEMAVKALLSQKS